MKISGFTFVKNADKFYFPVKASILSILNIVDEFVIAYAEGDKDDDTLNIIKSINSDKIKIYQRQWDPIAMKDGQIYADETNFALSKCTGDWCFYLQADECIHEEDHDKILKDLLNGKEFTTLRADGNLKKAFAEAGLYGRGLGV